MRQRQTPESIEAWFEEGLRCFQKPDGVGAVRAFRQVIDLDPGYRHRDGDNAYFYMGKIHEVEGDLDLAVGMYTRALTLDAWDEESLIGRGSCLTVQKAHDRAIEDFRKALSIPDARRRSPAQHLLYAIAENYRQQSDYTSALMWGQRALDLDPDNYRHQELVKAMQAKLQSGQGAPVT
ncbi:MAG: tetratricopeptide repeat protein [Desulfobacterales bacterium]|nr:tetratricopeptide repeat protein [Desulfobacterales bacterium]